MKNKSQKTFKVKKLIIALSAVIIIAGLAVAGFVLLKPADKKATEQKNDYNLNIETYEPREIYEGIRINYSGNYSGVFFEDGSDEIVSSVLMIELENTSDKDLQLVRVKALADDSVAEFEGTNIPAGKSAIILEKNRMKSSDTDLYDFSAENVAFFSEKMSLMQESFSVSLHDGYLELTNISGKDTEGTIYVYYKNTADDKLYGGITYRATVKDVVKDGDTVRVVTNHSTEKSSQIVAVENIKG